MVVIKPLKAGEHFILAELWRAVYRRWHSTAGGKCCHRTPALGQMRAHLPQYLPYWQWLRDGCSKKSLSTGLTCIRCLPDTLPSTTSYCQGIQCGDSLSLTLDSVCRCCRKLLTRNSCIEEKMPTCCGIQTKCDGPIWRSSLKA